MPTGKSHIRQRGGGGGAGARGRSFGSPGLAVPVGWRVLRVMEAPPDSKWTFWTITVSALHGPVVTPGASSLACAEGPDRWASHEPHVWASVRAPRPRTVERPE